MHHCFDSEPVLVDYCQPPEFPHMHNSRFKSLRGGASMFGHSNSRPPAANVGPNTSKSSSRSMFSDRRESLSLGNAHMAPRSHQGVHLPVGTGDANMNERAANFGFPPVPRFSQHRMHGKAESPPSGPYHHSQWPQPHCAQPGDHSTHVCSWQSPYVGPTNFPPHRPDPNMPELSIPRPFAPGMPHDDFAWFPDGPNGPGDASRRHKTRWGPPLGGQAGPFPESVCFGDPAGGPGFILPPPPAFPPHYQGLPTQFGQRPGGNGRNSGHKRRRGRGANRSHRFNSVHFSNRNQSSRPRFTPRHRHEPARTEAVKLPKYAACQLTPHIQAEGCIDWDVFEEKQAERPAKRAKTEHESSHSESSRSSDSTKCFESCSDVESDDEFCEADWAASFECGTRIPAQKGAVSGPNARVLEETMRSRRVQMQYSANMNPNVLRQDIRLMMAEMRSVLKELSGATDQRLHRDDEYFVSDTRTSLLSSVDMLGKAAFIGILYQ
eukprot:173226_1